MTLAPCSDCGHLPPAQRLVVLDLDGTLLDSDNTIAPRTKTYLRSIVNRPTFVIATGRSPRDAQDWAREIGADYVVALNGACLSTPGGSQLWRSQGLDRASLAVLRALAREHELPAVHIHGADAWYPIADDKAISGYAIRHGLTPSTTPPETIHQVELIGPIDALEGIAKKLDELSLGIVATRATDTTAEYLDIAPRDVTKAAALTRLLEMVGARWSDVLTVGDGPNDRGLFQHAYTSVAVPKAHTEIAALATHRITATSPSTGVRLALAAILDGDEEAAQLLTCTHRNGM